MTDSTAQTRSRTLFADGFLLTKRDIDWFTDQYWAARGSTPTDPRVSPLLADDLSGLPPALVAIAGFDPLRDEGETYARRCARPGSSVDLRRMRSLTHGFVNMFPLGGGSAVAHHRVDLGAAGSPEPRLRASGTRRYAEPPNRPPNTRINATVASKPKRPGNSDLRAADRKRNLAIQIGLIAIVVLFAVGLVGYIVVSDSHKKGRRGRRGDPGDVEQAGHPGRHASPRPCSSFYEDFLCPACGNFERHSGPTVSRLIDSGAIAADYYMVAILDSAQNENYSSRAGARGLLRRRRDRSTRSAGSTPRCTPRNCSPPRRARTSPTTRA